MVTACGVPLISPAVCVLARGGLLLDHRKSTLANGVRDGLGCFLCHPGKPDSPGR